MKTFTLFYNRLLLVAVTFLGLSTVSAQIVQVGSGTSTQRYPLGNYWGYERSASLYLSSEIGVTGNILSLAWKANTAGLGARPIKVYLLETTETVLTPQLWADQITGATLVYDESAYTPVAGWNTVTLAAPFAYGGQNLLVLVEANVGGYGLTTSAGNSVEYSIEVDRHAYWQEDVVEPTDSGTVTSERPNIRIGFPLLQCSGTPTAGTVTVSPSEGSAGSSYSVSADSYTEEDGITYQWQSNTNGAGWVNEGAGTATYVDLTGLTAPAFGTTIEYRLTVSCSNSGESSSSPVSSFFSDYCPSVPTSNDAEGILSVTVGSETFPVNDVTYYNYTGSVPDIMAGTTVVSSVVFSTGYDYDTHIWIDFDNDGIFNDSTEIVFTGVSSNAYPDTLNTSFLLPAGADTGQHRMRIGTADAGQAIPDPCYSGSYGVTIDLTVNILPSAICTGRPNAGTVAVSPTSGESGSVYNVSASNFTGGDSITYQWQSNTNGAGWVNEGVAASTYTNLTGLTAPSFGTIIEYRFVVNCIASGENDTSSVVSFTSGYCLPTANSDDETGITNVTLGSMSNSSNGGPAYTDFTANPITVYIGVSYPFSVNVNTEGNYTVNTLAWVDWNQNGVFGDIPMESPLNLGSATDVVDGATSASPLQVFIPAVPAGQYRVRIRAVFSNSPVPCGDQGWSEAEDYLLDIQPAPAPTVTGFSPTSGCGGTASVVITGTGFYGVTAVTIGGSAVTSYTVDSGTQITAIVGTGTTGNVSVVAAGGTAISATTFTVETAPVVAPIGGGEDEACTGTTLTFTNDTTGGVWAVSGAIATITQEGLFTAVSSGTVTVTYTVTNSGGCPTTANKVVTINNTPGVPNITQNDTICVGGSTNGLIATYMTSVSEFSGTTAGAPTYNRTNASGGASTYDVNYAVHYFMVTANGSYTFNQCAPSYDGFGNLYQGSFSPANPLVNWLAGNDDGNGSNCSASSRITVNLTAGTVYVLVSSAFSSGSGDYTWTFDANNSGDILAPVGTIAWYTSATGGTSIGNGSQFNPIGVTGSGLANGNTAGVYTFYAETQSDNCNSVARVPVSLVIDGAAPVAQAVTICAGSSTTLTAVGGNALTWYDADSNALGTGNTYTTGALSGNTVFYVQDSSVLGCLSPFTAVAVTVSQPSSYQQSIALCEGESVSVGTSTYAAEGTYTDTLLSVSNCDSVVTTIVSVTTVNATVDVSGTTATAVETGADYEWVNCATNQPVAGASGQSFTATADGDYKVVITKNGCTATSSCVSLVKTGIDNVVWANTLNIYPNPTSDIVNITFSKIAAKELFISITDVRGRVVYQSAEQINSSSFHTTISLGDVAKGVYLIKLNTENDAVIARQLILK